MVLWRTQTGVDIKKKRGEEVRRNWMSLYNQKTNEIKGEGKRNKIRNKRWRGAWDWEK